MNKFKIGDMVKVIETADHPTAKRYFGVIGKITAVTNNGGYYILPMNPIKFSDGKSNIDDFYSITSHLCQYKQCLMPEYLKKEY